MSDPLKPTEFKSFKIGANYEINFPLYLSHWCQPSFIQKLMLLFITIVTINLCFIINYLLLLHVLISGGFLANLPNPVLFIIVSAWTVCICIVFTYLLPTICLASCTLFIFVCVNLNSSDCSQKRSNGSNPDIDIYKDGAAASFRLHTVKRKRTGEETGKNKTMMG